jgi:magnesium-transporting ATPase (P-type)
MLWVNLIMDSLASLSLSTEPPVDSLLDRAPYSRSQGLVSDRMAFFIAGHGVHQIIVLLVILFAGDSLFQIPNGRGLGKPSVHYTVLFNAFVCMTLFNQINARKLNGERNAFEGIMKNRLFLLLMVMELFGQFMIVQFGGAAFKCVDGGLNGTQWLVCLILGLSSLVWQHVINFVVNCWNKPAAGSAIMHRSMQSQVQNYVPTSQAAGRESSRITHHSLRMTKS